AIRGRLGRSPVTNGVARGVALDLCGGFTPGLLVLGTRIDYRHHRQSDDHDPRYDAQERPRSGSLWHGRLHPNRRAEQMATMMYSPGGPTETTLRGAARCGFG